MIIDTPWNTTSKLPKLRAAGVTTILRYYNHRNSPVLPEKCLTPSEARAINDAGLRIGVTFEQRQDQVSDFSEQAGINAANRAIELADDIGQPVSSGIYFSVDCDLFHSSELVAVAEFFQGVQETFATAASGTPFL